MIGHQQIIKARIARFKPNLIRFHFGASPKGGFLNDIEKEMAQGLFPNVWIPESEVSKHQDLRFVFDCLVEIFLYTKEGSTAFVKNLIERQPKKIITVMADTKDTSAWIWERDGGWVTL